MSRTDKTNPYWLKIRRREGAVKGFYEHHRCGWDRYQRIRHPCDLDEPRPINRGGKWQRCEIWPKYSENNMLYGRHPDRSARKALGFEGGIRARLVRQRRDWRLEPIREDIDSSLGAPRRHCQVRDPWYWD